MSLLSWIIFFVIVTVCLLLIKGFIQSGNSAYTSENFSLLLDVLLKRGFDGGTLVLSQNKSDKFLQFRKYILVEGSLGIKMDFPKADWSSEYFDLLREYLTINNISYEEIKAINENELDFIIVNLKEDICFSSELSCYVFETIMKNDKETLYTASYENVSPWDEVITSRNHDLLTIKEGVDTIKNKNKN